MPKTSSRWNGTRESPNVMNADVFSSLLASLNCSGLLKSNLYTEVYWMLKEPFIMQRFYEGRAVICAQTSETGQIFSSTSINKAIHEMLSELEVGGSLRNAILHFL